MAVRGPITGSELVRGYQQGNEVLFTRTQVIALLAMTNVPSYRPGAVPGPFDGDEMVAAIQGNQSVWFSGADFAAYLLATGPNGIVPPERSATTLTGAERILGLQDNHRIAFNITEANAVKAGGFASATADTTVRDLLQSYTLRFPISPGFIPTTPPTPAPSIAPIARTLPVVSGQALQGQTVTATPGTYAVTPDSVTGQWYYTDTALTSGVIVPTAIPGATALSYTVQSGDANHTIGYFETATKGSASTLNKSVGSPAAQTSTVSKAGIDLTQKQTIGTQTGRTGFGLARNNGYAAGVASDGTDVWPAGQTWTLETSAAISTAPTSIVYAVRTGLRGYIAVNTDGRLIACYTNLAGTDIFFNGGSASGGGTNPVITDGNPHFIKIVATPTLVQLVYDGAVIASIDTSASGTPANAPSKLPGNTPFSIGSTSNSPTPKWVGPLDYVAVWLSAQGVTSPSASYAGSETGLYSLYNFENGWVGQSYTPTAPSLIGAAPTLSFNFNYVGSLISVATNGVWKNNPLSYSYQWYYADTNTPISGATSSGYTIQSADLGHTLKCQVTAINQSGPTAAFSDIQTVRTPGNRALVATNRFRTGRDVSGATVAGSNEYAHCRARARIGNSSTNMTVVFTNGFYYPYGIGVVSNDIVIRMARLVKKTDGSIIPVMYNGAVVSASNPITLKGGVFGGDLAFAKLQSAPTTGAEYFWDVWDYVAAGGQRPYQWPNGGFLSDELGGTFATASDGTLSTGQGVGVSTYIVGVYAEGITGPSVVTTGDSIIDQGYPIPGNDYDTNAGIPPSLSNPASSNGFIPNQSTIRYSGSVVPFNMDNYQAGGLASFMGLHARIAAGLGQPDWPFNVLLNQHWRNFAEPGGDASDYAAFADFIHARTPSVRYVQEGPLPFVDGPTGPLTGLNTDGFTTEANMVIDGAGTTTRDSFISYWSALGNGRAAAYLPMNAFVAGVNPQKWPVANTTATLLTAVSGNVRSFKVDKLLPVGTGLIFNTGSTTSGSEQAYAAVQSVTSNGDGTYQIITVTAPNKTYAANTVINVTYTADGTHPSAPAYGAMMATYFDQNLKSKLFQLGL